MSANAQSGEHTILLQHNFGSKLLEHLLDSDAQNQINTVTKVP